MYLLLLVSAARIGREEQIGWEVLKRGVERALTGEKVERLAEALSRHRLARMRVMYPSEVGGRQRGEPTPAVYFTVFGLKRLGGPRSRSPRRRRVKGDG